MESYCVNKLGDHEVHKIKECSHLPEYQNRQNFVAFSDAEAMRIAKGYFPNADGCAYCMARYHTR